MLCLASYSEEFSFLGTQAVQDVQDISRAGLMDNTNLIRINGDSLGWNEDRCVKVLDVAETVVLLGFVGAIIAQFIGALKVRELAALLFEREQTVLDRKKGLLMESNRSSLDDSVRKYKIDGCGHDEKWKSMNELR